MRIALLNNFEQEPDCTHWVGLRFGMNVLGHDYREFDVRSWTEATVLNRLRDFNPELIIYAIDDVINLGLHTAIRERHACPIVMWYCEIRTPETGGGLKGDLGEYIDVLFLSNDGQEQYYKEKNRIKRVEYLPQAAIPVKRAADVASWTFPIVFIGTVGFSGFFGRRAPYLVPLLHRPEFKHINGGTNAERMLYYRRMPEIYGSSKICLDVSHDWTTYKYCSNRYFTIPGCGGFSLTKRFPGCEEIYPDGVGKVYFDTPQEEMEKIEYYLLHDEERREVAERGLEHCKQYHTYPIRILQMLEKL